MKIEPHGEEGFGKDEYLWKYFDLHKFLHFISEKKLYFTRLDKFDDPLEGMTERVLGNLSLYESIPTRVEDLNPSFSQEQKNKIIKEQEDRKRYIEDSIKKSQTTQFANCWFLGNKESFAMWKLYSHPDSVAIRYKPNDLLTIIRAFAENYIDKTFQILSYGRVLYKNIWPFDFFSKSPLEIKFNAFKKDLSYEHEKEYRFVVVTPTEKANQASHFELFLGDFSKDDIVVFANPHMEDWKYENIKRILEKFSPQTELKRSILKVKKV